jgi:probable rRNA maturation factor
MQENFNKINLTKCKLSGLPFVSIKNEILGQKYEISLVLISKKRSKELNFKFREKNKPTNVLSFPLSKNSGEIFICPEIAKKECSDFDMSFKNFVLYLFIHGLLHLKGMDHSSRMDKAESKFLKKFGLL